MKPDWLRRLANANWRRDHKPEVKPVDRDSIETVYPLLDEYLDNLLDEYLDSLMRRALLSQSNDDWSGFEDRTDYDDEDDTNNFDLEESEGEF
jgi:hypothetical protein